MGDKTLLKPQVNASSSPVESSWTIDTQLEQNARASLVIDVGNLPSREWQRRLAVTKDLSSSCLF